MHNHEEIRPDFSNSQILFCQKLDTYYKSELDKMEELINAEMEEQDIKLYLNHVINSTRSKCCRSRWKDCTIYPSFSEFISMSIDSIDNLPIPEYKDRDFKTVYLVEMLGKLRTSIYRFLKNNKKHVMEIHRNKKIINNVYGDDKDRREYFFNTNLSILSISGVDVKIRKTTKQYEVLREIFKDTAKDWQFSEIAENIDKIDKDNWKKLYDTINAIANKIAIETGIRDFFITSTQSVKINESFIKKA
jgi:hypothetical protein